MTLITDKTDLRRTLEWITADLRHAYRFLSTGNLVSTGQQNVADLVARQIRRLEQLMDVDDAVPPGELQSFHCPLCAYRTSTAGAGDIAARNALVAHLQRDTHRLSRAEAKAMALKVSPLGESARSADAVDPSATVSGTPTTRVKESS